MSCHLRASALRLSLCLVTVVLVTVVTPPRALRAQTSEVDGNPYDAEGFHANREYLSLLPFEAVDTMGGNLVLTFTDLVLPGNAGFDLHFQRTYNSKRGGGWGFGLAGIPMRVLSAEYVAPPNPGDEPLYPILITADNARHPSGPLVAADPLHVGTSEFWRYDREADVVRLPNGLVGTYGFIDDRDIAPGVPYGNNVRYVTAIDDPFGNHVDVAWTMTAWGPVLASVVQHLGEDQARTVTFTPRDGARIDAMTYADRTWDYQYNDAWQLTRVDAPEELDWTFGYAGSDLTSVTTPHGGVIEYGYANHVFQWGTRRGEPYPVQTRVLVSRTIDGRTWTYAYPPDTQPEKETTINGPFSTVKVRYGSSGGAVDAVNRRIVLEGTNELERETITYHAIRFVDWGTGSDYSVAVPQLRTITRNGQTWTTEHHYAATHYGDYGQPWKTDETGTAGTRTTTREFTHDFTPYIRGSVTKGTVTADGQSFETRASFTTATGFRESQTVYGVTTTFTPDRGNVASAAHSHGATVHTTSFGYAWGAVSSITTPEYAITRGINSTGTVASETRNGHTTGFTYDKQNRVITVDPPDVDNIESQDVITAYSASAVTVTRGVSSTRTDLDGFGRPTATTNAVNVRTTVAYDVEGRQTSASYPFYVGGSVSGETFHYDGLGRVTQIDRPGACEPAPCRVTIAHAGLTQTITDEQGRPMTQYWEAFGDPRAAQLESVTDAASQVWAYRYNGLGLLTEVDAPGAYGSRSWSYGLDDRLDAETHPESGTTTYSYSGGRLETRTDARGIVQRSHYDGNDRLRRVQIEGDPGQDLHVTYDADDQRLTMTSAGVSTTFSYDAARRLRTRSDVIGSRSFTTRFDYDLRDNLTETEYPSGREVVQDYDAGNRVTKVWDRGGPTYATAIAYHANGVLATYTAGNGLGHSVTLTADGRPAGQGHRRGADRAHLQLRPRRERHGDQRPVGAQSRQHVRLRRLGPADDRDGLRRDELHVRCLRQSADEAGRDLRLQRGHATADARWRRAAWARQRRQHDVARQHALRLFGAQHADERESEWRGHDVCV
jgi:YD repeat-containing protein